MCRPLTVDLALPQSLCPAIWAGVSHFGGISFGVCLWPFQTGSCHVAPTGQELLILLLQPPKPLPLSVCSTSLGFPGIHSTAVFKVLMSPVPPRHGLLLSRLQESAPCLRVSWKCSVLSFPLTCHCVSAFCLVPPKCPHRVTALSLLRATVLSGHLAEDSRVPVPPTLLAALDAPS